MARTKTKVVDTTDVISVRISKKTKYLLDLACRTTNLSIGRYVEEAVMDSFSNVETKDKRRNLKTAGDDFWDEKASERFLYLIDNLTFTLLPEEERIKNVLNRFKYKSKNAFMTSQNNYKHDLIDYCWNEIQEFAETTDKNDDFKSPDDIYSRKYINARENLIKKIEEYGA